jgi:hypothetical protein
MSDQEAVADLARAINDCWREGRYDDLRRYFHEDVVVAMPGFERWIEGAVPLIDSYRDFGRRSRIHRFEAGEPRIDLFGPTAVAATSFAIDYELEGTRYRETGADLLVFVREGGEWRVRWRTLIPKTSESGPPDPLS